MLRITFASAQNTIAGRKLRVNLSELAPPETQAAYGGTWPTADAIT